MDARFRDLFGSSSAEDRGCEQQVSSDQGAPRLVGLYRGPPRVGDEKLPSYIGMLRGHCRDPHETTSICLAGVIKLPMLGGSKHAKVWQS